MNRVSSSIRKPPVIIGIVWLLFEVALLLVYLSPRFSDTARVRSALISQINDIEKTFPAPVTTDAPRFSYLATRDSAVRALETQLLATVRSGEDDLSVFIPSRPLEWAAQVSAVVTFAAGVLAAVFLLPKLSDSCA